MENINKKRIHTLLTSKSLDDRHIGFCLMDETFTEKEAVDFFEEYGDCEMASHENYKELLTKKYIGIYSETIRVYKGKNLLFSTGPRGIILFRSHHDTELSHGKHTNIIEL